MEVMKGDVFFIGAGASITVGADDKGLEEGNELVLFTAFVEAN